MLNYEELRCPFRDHLEVYSAYVGCRRVQENDSLPAQVHFPEEGSALLENQLKWHKQCHLKFNNTRLEREKLKENPVAESGPLSKRRSMGRKKLERNKDLCIFCEMSTSEKIHEFTLNANKSVSQMATEVGDMDLLVKLSEGDLVASM